MSLPRVAVQIMAQVPPAPPVSTSWAEAALPWFQIIAVVIAAVAAVASWRSASASLRTAGRADETARRATEALSRLTRPELVDVFVSARGDRVGREPWPMDLIVRNDAPRIGYLVGVRVERADGLLLAEVKRCSIELPGDYMITHVALGNVPAARPHPSPDEVYQSDTPEIVCVVLFTDAAQLVTWRQRSYVYERVGWEDRDGEFVPRYTYGSSGRDEPELAS